MRRMAFPKKNGGKFFYKFLARDVLIKYIGSVLTFTSLSSTFHQFFIFNFDM